MANKIKPGNIFPSVSASLQVVIIFWIWMFGIIAAANVGSLKNSYGAISPPVLFSLGFFGLGFIAFREVNSFQDLKKVLGLKVIIPGFGILSTFTGLGIGFIVYTLFTRKILDVATTASITSIAQPFYNPYTASATGFNLGVAAVNVLFIFGFVAVFEESYKIGLFKILSNSFHKLTRTIGFLPEVSINVIMYASLLITFTLWGLWHFFSWGGLTPASIVTAVMYGFIFYIGFFILGGAGIFPIKQIENKKVGDLLSGVVIYPAIGTHFIWDSLVAEHGFGLSGQVLLTTGVSLVVLSIAAMYVARRIWG